MATETAKQAGKFGIVGISNTLIDLGIFNVLTLVFGVYVVIANVISVSIAILNSYIWNKTWTFQDTTRDHLVAQFTKFVSFSLVGMGIQTLMVWLLATRWTLTGELVYAVVELVRLDGVFPEIFVINNWAKVWGIGLALVWNFFAYKKWTFNTKK
jgi:putative flippase GtrA